MLLMLNTARGQRWDNAAKRGGAWTRASERNPPTFEVTMSTR
jgi:hypothetical protein